MEATGKKFVVSEAVVKTSRPWVRICLCMWLLGAVTSTPVHVGNGTHFSFLLPITYVARSRRKTAPIRDVRSCAVTGGREELRACVHVGFASNFSIFLFVEAWRGCWFHGNVSQLWKLPRPVWGAGWVHNFRNLHPTHVCAGFLAVLPPKNGFCGSAAGVVIIRHMRVALEAAPVCVHVGTECGTIEGVAPMRTCPVQSCVCLPFPHGCSCRHVFGAVHLPRHALLPCPVPSCTAVEPVGIVY